MYKWIPEKLEKIRGFREGYLRRSHNLRTRPYKCPEVQEPKYQVNHCSYPENNFLKLQS